MATSPEKQKGKPREENLLMDYVRRLEQHKGGRKALHIHLSGLRPFNRRENHIRVAAASFETLVTALQGQLFVLKNSDIFLVYLREAEHAVETEVQRVRYLFSDDPLILEESKEDSVPFCTWYDVETQFEDLLRLVQGMVEEEKRREAEVRAQMDTRAQLKVKQKRGEPLTPEVLARVETALARADLSNLVRRQFVCGITDKGAPEPLFSELFMSIKDLRETLIPGVDLVSNRWLFQHLTQTLDRRMLAMLVKTDNITISGDISFNLNVSTLLSPEFLNFDDNLTAARRGAMVVELQKLDIFADLGAYLFAREFVQDRGYRICIDGLTYETLPLIDRERLGADLVKLVWHSDMVDRGEDMHQRIRSLVKRSGDSRVVLCRCDDREAVDFGRAVGITLFQGRQVENLIAEESRKRELRRLKKRIQRS